jgi:hypothetical protein
MNGKYMEDSIRDLIKVPSWYLPGGTEEPPLPQVSIVGLLVEI